MLDYIYSNIIIFIYCRMISEHGTPMDILNNLARIWGYYGIWIVGKIYT